MRTIAIAVENLCVPCSCRCRYCLLSYGGRPVGVDYRRGRRFTERFFGELEAVRPDLGRTFYIGYSMDTPELSDYIRFCRDIGSPAGEFLQLNGLRLRDERETERFAGELSGLGIRSVDLTFYGLRESHDRFAGRAGDFDFLLRLARAVTEEGIELQVSLPILRDNRGEAAELLEELSQFPVRRFFAFLPHCKGRGWSLRDQRLTKREYEALPETVRDCFSRKVEYRSEGEWLQNPNVPEPESRTLTLSLTPDNIDRLEGMGAREILEKLEDMDERYYAAMPRPVELASQYGDPAGERMYRLRDLLLEYRQRHYRRYGAGMPNMDDESGHFSVRS